MSSIQVSKLFTLAMKRVNILQAGESLSPEDLDDALDYANAWLDSVATESISLAFQLRTTWSIVSNQASYTVGTGGNINIPKPNVIDNVNYIDNSLNPAIERVLTKLTADAWDAVPIKTLTNPLPSFYYWQPTFAGDLGTLYFWLIPTSSVLTGVLYTWSGIQQFTAGTQTVDLPPGGLHFCIENLAVYFATTWRENLPIDPNLIQSAMDAKANYKRLNASNQLFDMSIDPALTYKTPVSNIYVGP